MPRSKHFVDLFSKGSLRSVLDICPKLDLQRRTRRTFMAARPSPMDINGGYYGDVVDQ